MCRYMHAQFTIIYNLQLTINVQFFGFTRKIVSTKPNKAQTK